MKKLSMTHGQSLALQIVAYILLGLFFGSMFYPVFEGGKVNFVSVGISLLLLSGVIIVGRASGMEKDLVKHATIARFCFAFLVIVGLVFYIIFRNRF